MHVFSIMSVADIVLAGPNRVQPGLHQSKLPNFVEEWQRPGKRTTWQQFFESLPPNYQNKARQDWYKHKKDIASQRKSSDPVTAPTEEGDAPNPGGAEGEQATFPFAQPGASPQDFLTRLRGGVKEFGNAFNIQTIRPYNNAIQHALRSIQTLSKLPEIPLETVRAGEALLKKFQEIQAGDAEDALLVQQLGELAQSLASAAGYAPGTATNLRTRAPQQQPPHQQNWWQRMMGAMPGRAASS